jgi:hypothetical protein
MTPWNEPRGAVVGGRRHRYGSDDADDAAHVVLILGKALRKGKWGPATPRYRPSVRAMMAALISDVPEYSRPPTASHTWRSNSYSVVNP